MRKFSSYGPPDTDIHFHAPRQSLINSAYNELTCENSAKGGHYITVWAPRQTGKTWTLQQVVKKIRSQNDFDAAIISMGSGKTVNTDQGILELFIKRLSEFMGIQLPRIDTWADLDTLFSYRYFPKPIILIADEFDALAEDFINKFANEFREMYISRLNEDKPADQKTCRLHGLALIGVRSVLGIENVKGSPFNVQRSVHIPNLTKDEVKDIFQQYTHASGQTVEPEVIDRIYTEFKGQPGLTCWFGEQLTEVYNKETDTPIGLRHFKRAYTMAAHALPNNNILNIISKVKAEPYKTQVLDLFNTGQKIEFFYDDRLLNYLYMNGVIDIEDSSDQDNCLYVRFSSPFVQKRLFSFFSRDLFKHIGQLHEPFQRLDNVITQDAIHIRKVIKLYETYLRKNRSWLFQDAPRRKDLRIYEAVYHFNFYMFLHQFLQPQKAQVYPEFPTGNGRIDIIIKYAGRMYGIELKSYTDENAYKKSISQAASYGKQLRLAQIALVFFVDDVDDDSRNKYEINYQDQAAGVTVKISFVAIGN